MEQPGLCLAQHRLQPHQPLPAPTAKPQGLIFGKLTFLLVPCPAEASQLLEQQLKPILSCLILFLFKSVGLCDVVQWFRLDLNIGGLFQP